MTTDEKIKCTMCGSIQIHAEKRGWNLTTGFIGSGKIRITCLKCGNNFKPGDKPRRYADYSAEQKFEQEHRDFGVIAVGAVVIICLLLYKACSGSVAVTHTGESSKSDREPVGETIVAHTTTADTTLPVGIDPPAVSAIFDIKPLLHADNEKAVRKLVGKPQTRELCCSTDNGPKFLIEHFKWGEVQFNHAGEVEQIDYEFLPGGDVKPGSKWPHSHKEALEMVGLQETSQPEKSYGNGFYRWCPTCTPDSPPLICNGIHFHDVTVWVQGDKISAISVSGKGLNEKARE